MYADDDPRSWAYPRKYTRPKIGIIKAVFFCLIVASLVVLSFILLHKVLCLSQSLSLVLSFFMLLLIILIKLKSIAIWCVKCYQRFAPISIRSMCRFEPSCSEYMILSVEKYGAFIGIKKGINRIIRCAHKDGGFDFPS